MSTFIKYMFCYNISYLLQYKDNYWEINYITRISLITLGNNFFLLFECYLDFYNWFRVILHCWIRKWHLFLSIRPGLFFASLIWKKSNPLTKLITFLWYHQLIFVNTYNPKYVFNRKSVLPITYIDYLIKISIPVNWIVGIDKGKYT